MFIRNIIKRRGHMSSRFQEMMYRPNGIGLKVLFFFLLFSFGHEEEKGKARKHDLHLILDSFFFLFSSSIVYIFFYSFVAEMREKKKTRWYLAFWSLSFTHWHCQHFHFKLLKSTYPNACLFRRHHSISSNGPATQRNYALLNFAINT